MRSVELFVLILVALLGPLWPEVAQAQLFDTKAPYALLMDYDSGTVLFEKSADERFQPASLAKLMTVEYVFNELKQGHIKETDTYIVSEHAWRTGGAPSGGSAMFAALKSTISVHDLLRGMIVQSGNDAAIVLAEGLAGTEEAFADLLNKRAATLGLKNSNFQNANGLSNEGQGMTARDLAILARHIIHDYPDYYSIFAEPEFTWNKIRQLNRNPLISQGIGVDGLKTGYIEASGYGLVASALRNGQRLILVIAGLDSSGNRESEAKKLLDWGFSNFEQITAFKDGETIAEASVYGGDAGRVPLKAAGAVNILIARDARDALKARVVYLGPVMAPIGAGVEVGTLRVFSGDRLVQETPVYTAAAVGRGSLRSRALDAIEELALGWIPGL